MDTVVVRNSGPDAAEGVTLSDSWTDAAGQNVDLAAITTSQGARGHAGSTVTCALGDLLSGASATVSITLVPAGAGTLVDSATVAATTQDPTRPTTARLSARW